MAIIIMIADYYEDECKWVHLVHIRLRQPPHTHLGNELTLRQCGSKFTVGGNACNSSNTNHHHFSHKTMAKNTYNTYVQQQWKRICGMRMKKKHTQRVRKLSYEMLNEKYGEKTARNRSVYYCDAAVAVLSEWRYSLFSAFHFPCYSVFYMNENKINIICITIRRALASCYARTIIIIIRLVHARCISIHRTQNGRDVAVTRIPHKRKCQ